MGNCTSKKSAKFLKVSTGNTKIFTSKMEKDQEIHSKGMFRKVVPLTKGEMTSFGFKKKAPSHLPIPVTLTSHTNAFLEANEKDSSSGASQKNLSEGYQSGSSVESLCHAPFKSTPKMVRKRNTARNQQQGPSALSSAKEKNHSHEKGRGENGSCHMPGPHRAESRGSTGHGSADKPSSGCTMNNTEVSVNKFGFRQATLGKATDLNGRTTPLPVSRTAFFTGQSSLDMLKKSDFMTRSRSEGPQPTLKQGLESSNSIQPGLNESKATLTNGGQPKKFTLQTSQLPKPQFPVRVCDTKTAKTAANYYRRGGIRNDSNCSKGVPITEDSGFESHSSANNTLEKKMESLDSSPGSRVRRRLPACKGKKLEMKVVGNKFELLKENEENDSNVVTEISLIKLPPFPISRGTSVINTGLVEERTNQYLKRISRPQGSSKRDFEDTSISSFKSSNPPSNSHGVRRSEGSGTESGEEKLSKDSRKSEKFLTSEGCLEADDVMLPGEAMAEDESLSLSFEESVDRRFTEKRPNVSRYPTEVDTPNTIRLDALKLSKELKYKLVSPMRGMSIPQKASSKSSVVVHLMKDEQDEEMFPSDSILEPLSSDSDSLGDKGENKNNDKEKNFKVRNLNVDLGDIGIEVKEAEESGEPGEGTHSSNETDIEEDDLDNNVDNLEETQINSLGPRNSPNGPGTPTHTSNSLSLSDGRDFLIDDEIADQPQLCFSEKYLEIPHTDDGEVAAKDVDIGSDEEQGGLEEKDKMGKNSRNREGGSETPNVCSKLCRSLFMSIDSVTKTALEEKVEDGRLEKRSARLNSEDTLSPCDSIASDDLMLDFECNSAEEIPGRLDANDLETIVGKRNDENWKDSSSRIFVQRSESEKSPKTGPKTPEIDSSPREAPKAKGTEDVVVIDRVSYQDVFEDVVSMKAMLVNLKCLLSASEENLQENGRLHPVNGPLENNFQEELTDLRRQVLFLQQQLEEREKTVQVLKLKINKKPTSRTIYEAPGVETRTQCNAATQTGLDQFQQEFPRFRICRITPVV